MLRTRPVALFFSACCCVVSLCGQAARGSIRSSSLPSGWPIGSLALLGCVDSALDGVTESRRGPVLCTRRSRCSVLLYMLLFVRQPPPQIGSTTIPSIRLFLTVRSDESFSHLLQSIASCHTAMHSMESQRIMEVGAATLDHSLLLPALPASHLCRLRHCGLQCDFSGPQRSRGIDCSEWNVERRIQSHWNDVGMACANRDSRSIDRLSHAFCSDSMHRLTTPLTSLATSTEHTLL